MQHGNSGLKENQCLPYHLHPIPEDVDLKDVVAFPYGEQMQCDVQVKREVLLDYADLL